MSRFFRCVAVNIPIFMDRDKKKSFRVQAEQRRRGDMQINIVEDSRIMQMHEIRHVQ